MAKLPDVPMNGRHLFSPTMIRSPMRSWQFIGITLVVDNASDVVQTMTQFVSQ
jgi:hypothetical protein